ncbi:30S ribosomal protein S16 [Candidatus Saccharibacteria bacterium]|nr:30S ribosomal protein S16 [Candidatus Saccharibacteria bacterium]
MLAIRLQRNGRTHYPVYRIIVQEAQRHPLSGRIVAEVGSYNPHTKEVVLDKETVKKYLSNGAQPSGRVIRILKSQKVTLPKWVKVAPEKSAKAKHADKLRKNQPKEETPAEAPASEESPAEAPAEEKSAEVSAE